MSEDKAEGEPQGDKGSTEKPESPTHETSPALPVVVSPDGKPTKGEELFLVHLNRYKKKGPDVDDFDFEPRKRSRSVGEELWEVHLKRSKGLPPDYDTDEPANHPVALARKAESKRKTATSASKPEKVARCSGTVAKVMHLRNRDVTIGI